MSEAETQETTKLLDVISVTDSEVATTGGRRVVSPETVLPAREEKDLTNDRYFSVKWDALNKDLGGRDGCSTAQLTCHCCGAGCGEVKAGDFFVAILLNTDELSFIYHTRLQA